MSLRGKLYLIIFVTYLLNEQDDSLLLLNDEPQVIAVHLLFIKTTFLLLFMYNMLGEREIK